MSRPEVVVVTGASAGVGRATVRAFARRGASLGLLARGRDGLEAARGEVEAAGGRGLVLPTDVVAATAFSADAPSAIAREKQLKGWSRAKKEALIATINPEWRDLSEELFGADSLVFRRGPSTALCPPDHLRCAQDDPGEGTEGAEGKMEGRC